MKQSKIFYFCFSDNQSSGGNKEIYKHVDILNQHNYQAFVLHTKKNFKITWFNHQTQIIDLEQFEKLFYQETDFIVLPEDLGSDILSFSGKKIIFNQNIYYGFYVFPLQKLNYPYLSSEVRGVLVVSAHNQKYLNFAYPKLDIFRVYCGVDSEKFDFCPLQKKKKKIACNPAKRPLDISLLYHLLQSRSEQGLNVLRDYEWVFIENKTEIEVAQILQESLLFVFLSKEEGFPLMPLEAMACGCLVVAYNVGPMTEYLPSPFLHEQGDMLGIASSIEAIAQSFAEDIEKWETISKTGRDIALQYSLQRESESVIATWEEILQKEQA
jgi:glycosyltransferase involved in cell wall biosynthesis